jgi:hypothetical protein
MRCPSRATAAQSLIERVTSRVARGVGEVMARRVGGHARRRMTKKAVSKKGVAKKPVSKMAISKKVVAKKPSPPPDWDTLRDRVGLTDDIHRIYFSWSLAELDPPLSPDARMVFVLSFVSGHLLSDGSQFFITNGLLPWRGEFFRALRRLGSPTARLCAEAFLHIAIGARLAAPLEDRCGDDTPEGEAAQDSLDGLASVLHHRADRPFFRLEPTLRREVAAWLDGKPPTRSRKPFPSSPRLSPRLLCRWG